MRTSGMIPYITTRQIATESSSTPKSVMNTMVGGYFCAASFAAHASEGESVSKRIASVTAIVLRTQPRPGLTEDEMINFSLLSKFSNEMFLDFTRDRRTSARRSLRSEHLILSKVSLRRKTKPTHRPVQL